MSDLGDVMKKATWGWGSAIWPSGWDSQFYRLRSDHGVCTSLSLTPPPPRVLKEMFHITGVVHSFIARSMTQ